LIETQELTKIFRTRGRVREVIALDRVSLRVEAGEILGLLGPNGAGKTTFFKTLLGLTKSTSGTIELMGREPSDPKSRLAVGYLPENHRFPQHLTAKGLLYLSARLHNVENALIEDRCTELLELVDMTRWTDTKITKFSKGMTQRVGLAQAMMSDPELLLLDEPTDGVDPVGKVELRELFERIRAQGKTVILNSHLLSEVESVADRVAILQKGKLLRVSSIEELTVQGCKYEIECKVGQRLFELPEKVGKVISVGAEWLIVELPEEENINHVIDLLRNRKISIRSIKRVKLTLEQSFLETIGSFPAVTTDDGSESVS
jgi:ABC-2 type transport system ATP-binding protein